MNWAAKIASLRHAEGKTGEMNEEKMASHFKSRAFFRPTHGAKPNSSAPISHLSLKRNKYLLGEVSPYSAYNHLFMVKRETFNRFPPIRRRAFTLHLFIYGHLLHAWRIERLHKRHKSGSRAVQVSLTSRASVAHEPYKCCSRAVQVLHANSTNVSHAKESD